MGVILLLLYYNYKNIISWCMPTGKCGLQMEAGEEVDCDVWCTTDEYPYQSYKNYPINFLWAYGNFSRLVVADTNIVCQGFNPDSKYVCTSTVFIIYVC